MLDRLTHRVHIIEANGQSFRLKAAKRRAKGKQEGKTIEARPPPGEGRKGNRNPKGLLEYPKLTGDTYGIGCYTFTPPPAALLDRRRQPMEGII
jgi:hypothetical protein